MVFRKTLLMGGTHKRHIHVGKRKFFGGSLLFDNKESRINDIKPEEFKTKINLTDSRPNTFMTGKQDTISYLKNPHVKKPIKLLL